MKKKPKICKCYRKPCGISIKFESEIRITADENNSGSTGSWEQFAQSLQRIKREEDARNWKKINKNIPANIS